MRTAFAAIRTQADTLRPTGRAQHGGTNRGGQPVMPFTGHALTSECAGPAVLPRLTRHP